MKLKYKQKLVRHHLIFALIWSGYSLQVFTLEEKRDWLSYGWILISIAWISLYFYNRKYPYVSIQNGIMQVGGPLGKKVNLDQIRSIRKFAGDYKINAESKIIKINTNKIDNESLQELNAFFESLEIEWT